MRAPLTATIFALLALACLQPALAAPAKPAAPPASMALMVGPSLATPTGTRLFPRLVGLPMPGWLKAYGGAEMGTAYEGYHEEQTLAGGVRLVKLRTQGLLGVYLIRGDRCIGHLLFEPHLAEAPEALPQKLKASGFKPRSGVMATRDRTYGAHTTLFERRRAGQVEQVIAFELSHRQDTVLGSRTVIGAEAVYPESLAASLAPVITQGTTALAEFCRADEQNARSPRP